MDHFVQLDKLPDDFQFPPDLQERMYFDAAAHKLVFRGYMSKSDFDRLSQRTRDWGFRRSLEELFRLSVPEIDPRQAGGRRLIGAFTKLFRDFSVNATDSRPRDAVAAADPPHPAFGRPLPGGRGEGDDSSPLPLRR